MIDAIATERHFVDHLASVWSELPERGTFWVSADLLEHARGLAVDAAVITADVGPDVPPAGFRAEQPALVAAYGDIKKGRRLGYGRFAFLEHGIGQSYAGDREARRNPSYAGGEDRDDVGLFLVPNEDCAQRWHDAYPAAAVEIVGCPKLDALPARAPSPGPVVAFSFHWPCSAAPETRPAYSHFAPVLPAIARRFRTIGHTHPRFPQLERSYRRMGIPFVPSFDDVCRQADVYVCDNSSTLYEFASTGRPVVVLNCPDYRRRIQHGLRFWRAADVGIQVDEPEDLGHAIAAALEDSPALRARREQALELVYAYRSGAATRAAAAIGSWVSARKDRVAA